MTSQKLLSCCIFWLALSNLGTAKPKPECTNKQTVPFTVEVTGPFAAEIQNNLQNGDNSGVMAKDNRAIFTFDDPVDLVLVEFQSKKANKVTLTYKDAGGSVLEVQDVFPPFPETFGFKQNSVDQEVNGVKSVEFDFESESREWATKDYKFYICVATTPTVPTRVPSTNPPPTAATPTTERPPPGEPCTCRVRGDPILMPCSGKVTFLSGRKEYLLAEYISSLCKFAVYIETKRFPPPTDVIPVIMRIETGYYVLKLDRDHNLQVSGQDTKLPWNGVDVTCRTRKNQYLMCTLSQCDAEFGFYGDEGSSSGILTIPGNLVKQLSGKCSG